MALKRDSPAVSLSKKIVAKLEKEELLDVSRVDRFVDLLATGKLREGDWKLALEKVPRSPRKSGKRR